MFLIVPFGAIAHAAPNLARPSCDNDFYDVLKVRSWMLASREYETAQEFLETQRDSVLLQTCHNYSFSDFDGDSIDMFQTAVDSYMSSNFPNGCRAMNDVWNLGRCADFSMAEFINFTQGEYQGPRSCPSPTARTNAWDAAVAASQPAMATPAASGGGDALVTYLDKTSWSVAGSCSASNLIETGVKYQVGLGASATYVDDAVCITPGCYYNGSSCQ